MDFNVSLPRTQKGHNVIWVVVVVYQLIKMARFIANKTTVTTPELVYQFVDELFRFYGLPIDIVSDRDPKFTSDFWTQVFTKLETTLSISSTNHPQSDGNVISQVWSSKYTSTGYSPSMLMYWFSATSPD